MLEDIDYIQSESRGHLSTPCVNSPATHNTHYEKSF